MFMTFVTSLFELVHKAGLVIQKVAARLRTPNILDDHLKFEVARDILKRKVSLLHFVSTFFNHVVVVVLNATPVFVFF